MFACLGKMKFQDEGIIYFKKAKYKQLFVYIV